MSRNVTALAKMLLAFLFAVPWSARAGSKMVMAHYMPWFVSQPFSGSWGWHWTMDFFDPNVINPTNGQQEIASWYYPLIGPYDSDDPAVLEYHVLSMKLGGIDGVIVDWYGMDDFGDFASINQRTLELFGYARKAGLKFALCYEDATIQWEINAGFITAGGAIAHAQQTMLYVQTNFFTDATYLRWRTLPVLLNFGPAYFHNGSDWVSNFSVLSSSNHPAFFTEDNWLDPTGTGAFDWPPMGLSQTNTTSPDEPVLSDAVLNNYLDAFETKAAPWPASISSAFPRFHDIYAQAGFEPSFGYLDDQSGATFRETLSRALTNDSAFIQLVTWNDFGEGTIIEPTVQYGYRDLGVVQDFRRQYLDAAFGYHTNDLALALRLYNLRERYGVSNPILSAEMDRVFTNIVTGDLAAASIQLGGMESGVPVIYDASGRVNQVQFTIGGYMSTAGVEIQWSPTLAHAAWQKLAILPSGTNAMVFFAPVPSNSGAIFFKVQNAVP